MTTVEETVELLKARIAQLEAGQHSSPDNKRAGLDSPPTSYPEGSRPFDFRPARVRAREKAIAKMRVLARTRGGVWDDNSRMQSVYGHRQASTDGMVSGCDYDGEDFRPSCQRTCWTPESETRFLYALGLKDLVTGALVPLTPPDPVNNHDAIRELVGLLKPQATAQDVTGQYPDRHPTRDEVGTQQAAVRVRKVS